VTAEAGLDPTLPPTTEVIVVCPSCARPLPLRVVRVDVDNAGGWAGRIKATVEAELDHSCNRRSRSLRNGAAT
jgi:hypothetical protein